AKVHQFDLYFRYWPMITKQHFQISKIQLDQVSFVGGGNGVLNHYFPVLYDPDYGKKYFKKKDPPTYLSNATIRLNDLTLRDINQLSLHLKALELRHLVSYEPLTLKLNGECNILQKQTLGFDISAESRVTGDNPDKALIGPWGYGDIKKLKAS